MGMNVKFDINHNPIPPTLLLITKSGRKFGMINATKINVRKNMTDGMEISFQVHKMTDGNKTPLWDEIRDFRLVWWKEQNMLFEITVEIDEDTETVKTISGTSLGRAELSQINLYLSINCIDDPNWDQTKPESEYIKSKFYDSENPNASILDRIVKYAPHYSIRHMDETLANLTKTYTFEWDGDNILDALNELAEEVGCLFVYDTGLDSNGAVVRYIDVYDLQMYCNNCHQRTDNLTGKCPNCGSTNMSPGYGEDTTIFLTSDELGKDIGFSSNVDEVKNCFKLEAGDEKMTADVINSSPSGTDRIYYFPGWIMEDMSDTLRAQLLAYEHLYKDFQTTYQFPIETRFFTKYNEMVTKYRAYNPDLPTITSPIVGYPALMKAYYNALDFKYFVESAMMPSVVIPEKSASQQAALITAANISPVAVSSGNMAAVSIDTARLAVKDMVKCICDSAHFKITINAGDTFTLASDQKSGTWRGSFHVVNYSDDTDVADSVTFSVTVNNQMKLYIKRKIDKALKKADTDTIKVSSLFSYDVTLNQFKTEIKKYGLNPAKAIMEAGQACLDILVAQSLPDGETWLQTDLYNPILDKLVYARAIVNERRSDLIKIDGEYTANGYVETYGMASEIALTASQVKLALNLQRFLGNDLWKEFQAYRREDEYKNDNYISDGLTTPQRFERAQEFLKIATDELYKSAELQHSISSSLNNLLYLDKFKPLLSHFDVGNWLRIRIDDEIYKLRLLEYDLDFDDFGNCSVEFSDVTKSGNYISDVKSVLDKATGMSSSYTSVKRQAGSGETSKQIINTWFADGLDATNTKIIGGADRQTQTWDEHGMLFRQYDSISDDEDSYEDTQMKIINSTIAITTDNWKTVKTAVGLFYYYDPDTGNLKQGYGVNGEVVIGKLMVGETLGLYNRNNTLKFDSHGLSVSNTTTNQSVVIDPSSSEIFKISKGTAKKIWMDSDGDAHFSGTLESSNAKITGGTFNISSDETDAFSVYAYSPLPLTPHDRNMGWVEITTNKYTYDGTIANIRGFEINQGEYFNKQDDNRQKTLRFLKSIELGIMEPYQSGWTMNAGVNVEERVLQLRGYDGIYMLDALYDQNGGLIVGSDRALKSNVETLDIESSANFVYSLKPSMFKYIAGTSGRYHHGFIAQDVKESMGENDWGVYVQSPANIRNQDQFLGLRYDEFIADIVATLQYQKQQIEELQSAISS